jgi:DNA-binding transcriptional regulator YiaG
MTPDQFRAALAGLGLSQSGFARVALVDARTVRRWASGASEIPGPVVALLGALAELAGYRALVGLLRRLRDSTSH